MNELILSMKGTSYFVQTDHPLYSLYVSQLIKRFDDLRQTPHFLK